MLIGWPNLTKMSYDSNYYTISADQIVKTPKQVLHSAINFSSYDPTPLPNADYHGGDEFHISYKCGCLQSVTYCLSEYYAAYFQKQESSS